MKVNRETPAAGAPWRIILLIGILLFGILLLGTPTASASDWWDGDYGSRFPLNLTNNNDTVVIPEDYTWSFVVNHTQFIADGNGSLSSGDDIRIVCNGAEVDRVNETGDWDTDEVTISFMSGFSVAAGSYDDTSCYLYSNYDAAANPPANWSVAFLFGDDFNDGDYDTGHLVWTVGSGTWSAATGSLKITATGGSFAEYIYIPSTYADNMTWMADVKTGNDFLIEFMTTNLGGAECPSQSYAVYEGADYYQIRYGSGSCNILGQTAVDHDANWNEITVHRSTGGIFETYYNDSYTIWDGTHTSLTSSTYFQLKPQDTDVYFDNIRAKRFIYPAGSVLLGAEELYVPVRMTSPTNTTYNVKNINLEWYNVSDIDTVWYSLNGAQNITLSGNTTLTHNQSGANTVFLYVNDTNGTTYQSDVAYTVELTVEINITDPLNGSYQTAPNLDIEWDYVSDLDCNYSYYSINGEDNVSMECSNVTIDITSRTSGYYNLTIFVNNTEGKSDSDFVNFWIDSPLINCSAPDAVVSVNFTFADEESLDPLNASAEYAITIYSGTYEYTYNLSVDDVSYFAICTYEPPWYANMILQYSTEDYSTRWYFFDNASLTASTSEITLYLLNSSSGSTVDVDVQNAYGYPLSDVYVKFQKYYISEDLYRTVAMMKSDDQAEGQSFLDITDAWYKYVVTQNGQVLRTIGPSLLADTSLVISTASGTTYTWNDYNDGIATSCEYDDTLEYIVCTIDDPSGMANDVCLKVEEYNVINMTLFNETCESSTSMTLMVNVSEVGSFNNSVKYTLYADTESGDVILEMSTVSLGAVAIYGLMGVLLTAMIYMTAAGAGYWNPAASIVLAALGIVVSVVVGFFVVELTAAGSLLLVFSIFIYKVKT